MLVQPNKLCVLKVVLVAAISVPFRAMADPPEDAALLDGLTVLIGGRATNQSEATAILLSDIEFQASVMMLYENRVAALPDTKDLIRARRVLVLVTILAAQARQLQETVSKDDVLALKKFFIDLAHGQEAVNDLLHRCGMAEKDLMRWLENTILASRQIAYAESQVEMPSTLYNEEANKITYEQLRASVKNWLYSILRSANVRIIR